MSFFRHRAIRGTFDLDDGTYRFVLRHEGGLQKIRFSFLCVWDLRGGQRARDVGDRPSLRRSLGSVLRKREYPHSIFPTPFQQKIPIPFFFSQVCELDL